MNKSFVRKSGWIIPITLALLLCAGLVSEAAKKRFPDPVGYLSDFAGVVEQSHSGQITAICRELDEKTGVQIGVAVFKDMGGDEIDGFTSRLFEQWMPGQKGVDNGILIVDAVDERKIRIEIGYGLESIITDAMSGRIRRDVMTPLLSKGKRGEAYLAGVASLASIVAKNENVQLESLSGITIPQVSGKKGKRLGSVLAPFFMLLVLGAIMLSQRRRGFRDDNRWGGGPWIGGGGFGGFGGGGGGGFGGFGGGMSGGGGSSGGY